MQGAGAFTGTGTFTGSGYYYATFPSDSAEFTGTGLLVGRLAFCCCGSYECCPSGFQGSKAMPLAIIACFKCIVFSFCILYFVDILKLLRYRGTTYQVSMIFL